MSDREVGPSPGPDQLAESLASALGKLLVNVAGLEEALHDAIELTALADGNRQDAKSITILTAGMRFADLIDKFETLCAETGRAREGQEQVKGLWEIVVD
jgi:hypothetical protein